MKMKTSKLFCGRSIKCWIFKFFGSFVMFGIIKLYSERPTEFDKDRKIFYLPTEDPKMVIGHNFPLTSLPFSPTNIVHKNYVKFIKKKSNDSKTELERTLHSRKLRIQKLCSLRHMKDQYKISGEINVYWNKKRKLIWCSTYQHIPWISKLIDDKLLEQSKRITKVNDKIFRKLIKKINNSNYTSFLILKNPLQRLLDLYKDKFLDEKDEFQDLRCLISQVFTIGKRRPKCNPSFAEFVLYVISQHKNVKNTSVSEDWMPGSHFCAPCLLDYEYMIHSENLDELKYLLKKISVPDENYSEALHLFYHYQHSNIGEFNKYFVGLNTTNLRSLIFDIYVNDFDLFGYDRAKYLKTLVQR
ncbi:UNVERIFIED_CONTAM: hypothetical protein RMT77_013298 [Armadillidium vulgare]